MSDRARLPPVPASDPAPNLDANPGFLAAPALATDLYQVTMAQAYWRHGMEDTAVFDLFARDLPPGRPCLVAAGLAHALEALEAFRFLEADLAYLDTLGLFGPEFLDWLGRLRFAGRVLAVPEGTPVFPNEPLLSVVAPLPQAQLVETMLINQLHLPTLVASKTALLTRAARGRPVVDFGLRRAHGIEAGVKAARAAWIAGASGTSNLWAGRAYGIPAAGTMAHSYVLAHRDERSAFRDFVELYPETVLLVDTYDTLAGVRQVAELARELGDGFRVRAIRLDSGDLAALARESRAILDAAGLERVTIFASGDLDERKIAALLDAGAPVDGFGVGTQLVTSADAPAMNAAYKLVEYAGVPRMKLSTGKATLPGQKQVLRRCEEGRAVADRIVQAGEDGQAGWGTPLLVPVMEGGRRLPGALPTLAESRERCREALAALPQALWHGEPYPVAPSAALRAEMARIAAAHDSAAARA